MLSYYLEIVTGAGFAGMIAGRSGTLVAPHGGTEARFGTNPIAFAFPSPDVAQGQSIPDAPVQVPFDRSRAERARRQEENAIEVPDGIYSALVRFAGKSSAS